MSKRSLYERWWGTTITLRDECFYVWVCLRETVSILKIHYAYIFFEDKKQEKMKLEFDEFEKDILIETIQHRLDTDKILVINDRMREDLTELLRKIEEDEYL